MYTYIYTYTYIHIYIYAYIYTYIYIVYAQYMGESSQPKQQRDFLWAAEASPTAQVPRKDRDAGKHCGGKVAGDPSENCLVGD